jgi:hypothetical protein
MAFTFNKTERCCVCEKIATSWNGFLLKSRERIIAGFCFDHKNIPCQNLFGRTGCYGIYHKGLGEIKVTETNEHYGLDVNVIEQ